PLAPIPAQCSNGDSLLYGIPVRKTWEIREKQHHLWREGWKEYERYEEQWQEERYDGNRREKRISQAFQAFRQANPPDSEQRPEVQTRLQQSQNTQERVRKDAIPLPEKSGLNIDRLKDVLKTQ